MADSFTVRESRDLDLVRWSRSRDNDSKRPHVGEGRTSPEAPLQCLSPIVVRLNPRSAGIPRHAPGRPLHLGCVSSARGLRVNATILPKGRPRTPEAIAAPVGSCFLSGCRRESRVRGGARERENDQCSSYPRRWRVEALLPLLVRFLSCHLPTSRLLRDGRRGREVTPVAKPSAAASHLQRSIPLHGAATSSSFIAFRLFSVPAAPFWRGASASGWAAAAVAVGISAPRCCAFPARARIRLAARFHFDHSASDGALPSSPSTIITLL